MYAPKIDSLWEADLAFVQDVAKENDGVNCLLVVIDIFSKYVWVRPMKNKTAHSLLEAFGSILSEGRKPEKLRIDKGTEFLNESFQQYLKNKNIHFYTANNEPKTSVVEQVNRTLKSKLYHYFTAVNSLCYIDVLQDLVDSYNNTFHRSIGHAPATVSLLSVSTVRRKLYGEMNSTAPKKFKFRVGNHVKLSLRKLLFKKGYKMNWTEEIFQITLILYLDLTFIIDSGGKLSTRLYDKRDDFGFHIVNFPFLSSNVPSGPSYGVYISQLIRYARCCSHYDDFRYHHKCLVDRLLSQGYKALRLEKSFKKFYGRYQDLTEKYRRSVNAMVSDSFPGQFLFNM